MVRIPFGKKHAEIATRWYELLMFYSFCILLNWRTTWDYIMIVPETGVNNCSSTSILFSFFLLKPQLPDFVMDNEIAF